MKIIKKVLRPAYEEEVLDHLKCELCEATTMNEDDWGESGYDVLETKVSIEEGKRYPNDGWGVETIVDICPKCFKEKLLPWLISQGAKIRKEEWNS